MARVDRLRVGLAVGTLLLVAGLAGVMAYSRYRAGRGWLRKMQQRSGATFERESDHVTYSQSLRGRTIFTLRAAKGIQHADGTTTLRDVTITVYGAEGREDKIYGKEFEWDEGKGIARAMGETEMDLQVAGAPGSGPSAEDGSAKPGYVHVKTSGLVYVRKLGVGATPELVEFGYAGLKCSAKGAEFDTNPSELHLLADVKVDGVLRGETVALRAERVDVARESGMVQLLRPVVRAGLGSPREAHGHAARAALHLREHGAVDRAEADGDVAVDEGTRHVTAARVETALNDAGRVESARLSGGVRMVDEGRTAPMEGTAAEVRVRFDREGRVVGGTGIGGLGGGGLVKLARRQAGAGGVWLERTVEGNTVDAVMSSSGKGSVLKSMHVVGAARVRSDAQSAGVLRTTTVAADDLTAGFSAVAGGKGARAASVRPDAAHGVGHTVLRQVGSDGAERMSTGDTLDVTLAAAAGDAQRVEVSSARQDGHVVFRNRTPPKAARAGMKAKSEELTTGSADHAAYDGGTDLLTLTGGGAGGSAHVVDGQTSLSAASLVVNEASGDAEARGNVVATLAGEAGLKGETRPATHLAAAHAVLHHATEVAEFDAGEGKPARMWQEASQVEANRIVVDGKSHRLTATPSVVGTVRSVFAGTAMTGAGGVPGAAKAGGKAAVPRVLRVESRELVYDGVQRQAVFSGPVVMAGVGAEVRAKQARAYFGAVAPGAVPAGGSGVAGGLPAGALERVVASGDVKIAEPGRQGSGEELVYRAADGSLLLTGTATAPPRVVDAQQGTVTGASLLVRPGESTIVVQGGADGSAPVKTRARVETKVRQ